MARLIFDLDGTLVHSLPALARAGNTLLDELGRATVTERTYMGYVGRGMAAQVTDLLAESGGIPEEGIASHLERFLEIYAADPITGCVPFPGVVDALSVLKAGHTLGVCTQKPVAAAWHLLKAMGLADAIKALTGGDTLDVLKPDPTMLMHTADALGSGEILYIGDSEVDRATARNAQVPFLLFEGGYRKSSIADLAPEAHFAHFDALPGVIAPFLKTMA